MKRLAIVLMLPFAASAQLALTTGGCTTGSPISSGSVYDFGQVAAGAAKDVGFFACNPGNSAVKVTTIAIAGGGFSVTGAPATYVDPPNNSLPLQFNVHFSGSTPASYSATLQVNTINVILLATIVPAPAISVSSTCMLNGSQVDFGTVKVGTTGLCTFSALNPYAQPLTVSSIALTGNGFQLTGAAPALPATLAPGAAIPLTVQLTPACGTPSYTGTLTVGAQTFSLTGTGSVPPLPAPSLTFDSNVFGSGQQHTITMSLSASYPCTASGYLTMAFTPGTSVVPDDPAVIFLAGSVRSLPFSVTPNSTQISIAGQSSIVFQTGTTEGTITFTVTANGLQITGNPSTPINIPPAVIAIESATASKQTLGQLNVEIIGFDNTYTAGVMSFTFFDTSGKAIGSGAVNADFTSQFQTYFTTSTGSSSGGSPPGSSFVMNVSFPITGALTQAGNAQALVGSVQATLTNAAGEAQTGSLTFQ